MISQNRQSTTSGYCFFQVAILTNVTWNNSLMVHLFLTFSLDEIILLQMAGLIYWRPYDLENKHVIVIAKTFNRKNSRKIKLVIINVLYFSLKSYFQLILHRSFSKYIRGGRKFAMPNLGMHNEFASVFIT